VLDWYAATPANPCDDCANLIGGSDRVFRGGAFDNVAIQVRVATNNFGAPITRYAQIGVRCARAL
jgi:formylglycine-generating enzyme required for sulfatase activity